MGLIDYTLFDDDDMQTTSTGPVSTDEWPFIMPPHRIKTYWREPGRMAMVARHVAAFTRVPLDGGGD